MNVKVPPSRFTSPPPKGDKSSTSLHGSLNRNPRKRRSPLKYPVKPGNAGCWVTPEEALNVKRVRQRSGENRPAGPSLLQTSVQDIPLPEEMATTRVERASSTEFVVLSPIRAQVPHFNHNLVQKEVNSNEDGLIDDPKLLPEKEMETENHEDSAKNGEAVVDELSQVSNIFPLAKKFLHLLAEQCGRTVITFSEQDEDNLWNVSVSFSTIRQSIFSGCAINRDETVAELKAYNSLLETLADDRIVPRELVPFIQQCADWGLPLAEQIALLLNIVSEEYAKADAPETIHKRIHEYSSRYWRKTLLALPAEIQLPEKPQNAESWVMLVSVPPISQQAQVSPEWQCTASSIQPNMPAHLQAFSGNNEKEPESNDQMAQKLSTTAMGLNKEQSKVSPIVIPIDQLPGYTMIRDPRLSPNREHRAVLPILRSDLRAPIEAIVSSRDPSDTSHKTTNHFIAVDSVSNVTSAHNDELLNVVTNELSLVESYRLLTAYSTMIEERQVEIKRMTTKLSEYCTSVAQLYEAKANLLAKLKQKVPFYLP